MLESDKEPSNSIPFEGIPSKITLVDTYKIGLGRSESLISQLEKLMEQITHLTEILSFYFVIVGMRFDVHH